jgi:hypothetical protein
VLQRHYYFHYALLHAGRLLSLQCCLYIYIAQINELYCRGASRQLRPASVLFAASVSTSRSGSRADCSWGFCKGVEDLVTWIRRRWCLRLLLLLLARHWVVFFLPCDMVLAQVLYESHSCLGDSSLSGGCETGVVAPDGVLVRSARRGWVVAVSQAHCVQSRLRAAATVVFGSFHHHRAQRPPCTLLRPQWVKDPSRVWR